ncbi:MAG: helix-turn-helix domain-containing protein [Candidatus Woesearchaeota archaeon]
MEKEVLRSLLDHKKIAVLRILHSAQEGMYLREVAKKSKVSLSSVFRILQMLEKIELVRSKEIGMMKFYSLVKNDKSKFLDEWFKEETVLDIFLEQIKGMEGLKKILLHEADQTHANLVLIGTRLDDPLIDVLVEKIKEKGFDLSYVAFNQNQFEKLNKMGIYAGAKVLL